LFSPIRFFCSLVKQDSEKQIQKKQARAENKSTEKNNRPQKNKQKKHDPKKHFTIHVIEWSNRNELLNNFINVI